MLVAPGPFPGLMRATEVAAALGRGLEAAGCPPPELCPVADGGPGTLEALLTALGGETAGAEVVDATGGTVPAGFGLLEGGEVAVVEAAGAPSGAAIGMLVAAAVDAGARVVLLAVGGTPAAGDGGAAAVAAAVAALRDAGGLRGARLVVLCDVRTPSEPGAVAMSGAGGGLAGALREAFGAVLEPGAGFVLGELGVDSRMRAARAVIVGEGRLGASTLAGSAAGELATRARQAGVPCFAVTAENALDRFGARILDLQRVEEAGTVAELEEAAGRLVPFLW